MTARLLLLLVLLLPGAAAIPMVTLQVSHGESGSANGVATVSYEATTSAGTLDTVVTTHGCAASAITATEQAGVESGTFTLDLGRTSCAFTVAATATDGVDTATARFSGSVQVGSTGAVLEEWVPLAVYAAIILYAGTQANLLAMTLGLAGIVSERAEVPLAARTAILVLVLVSLFPQLLKNAAGRVGSKLRGEGY